MLNQYTAKKQMLIILVSFIVFSGCSNTQSTGFLYKGRPVHPLLIKELLPNPETGKSAGCISLDSITNFDNVLSLTDSSTVNRGTWISCNFSNTGFTDYHFVSMYKKWYCVLVRYADGSFPMAYVCFFSINSNKLCLIGYHSVSNIRENTVKISGDNLLIGNAEHGINLIIKPINIK